MSIALLDLLKQPHSLIMGIVNVTPDSFSDGGRYQSADAAAKHALSLLDQGADILDIGGESTRPGAEPVSEQEELDRVIPVIEKLVAETDHPISVDTMKPQVMREATNAGVQMINDVNALQADGAMDCIKNSDVVACLMHKQGSPKEMQNNPQYADTATDVFAYLVQRVSVCQDFGIDTARLVVDPGIGFGKTLDDNLALLANLGVLKKKLNLPILIGVSRKSMIEHLLERSVEERLAASLGLAVQAVLNGAKIIRVHDVKDSFDAIRSVEAVLDKR